MEAQTTDTEMRDVQSPRSELTFFFSKMAHRIQEYEHRLRQSQASFPAIEQELDIVFREGASLLATALLVATSKEECVLAQVHEIQQSSETPLRSPVRQHLYIRLLCGLLIQVTTLYCAPKGKRTDETESRAGLYPELAAFGFAKKSSAAFEDRVTRRAALCPSFEIATQELNHDGTPLNVKEVRRIAQQCGESLLALRHEMVQSFLAGTLEAGTELVGEHVVVSTDGGRMKHRENKTQTGNGSGKPPKFHTDWREPKLIIIYIVDEKGKKKKKSRFWMDGTFLGPDHTAEMLAAWLYRLGISQAASVTFIADGAPWIWDRFDWVVHELQLPKAKVQYVLDFYHASHHISLALGELSLEEGERLKIYKELRSELKKSRWDVVVFRLEELGGDRVEEEKSVFCRELRFLWNHGERGHLNYVTYTRRGLPKGSGGIESAVRRVVNLRLKSNGMFWTAENAESMLQVRCQLLSSEWEVRLEELRERRLRTRRTDWQWQAVDRSQKFRNEANEKLKNAKNAGNQANFRSTKRE